MQRQLSPKSSLENILDYLYDKTALKKLNESWPLKPMLLPCVPFYSFKTKQTITCTQEVFFALIEAQLKLLNFINDKFGDKKTLSSQHIVTDANDEQALQIINFLAQYINFQLNKSPAVEQILTKDELNQLEQSLAQHKIGFDPTMRLNDLMKMLRSIATFRANKNRFFAAHETTETPILRLKHSL